MTCINTRSKAVPRSMTSAVSRGKLIQRFYPCTEDPVDCGVTNNQAFLPFDEQRGLVSLRRDFEAVRAIELFRDKRFCFCKGNYVFRVKVGPYIGFIVLVMVFGGAFRGVHPGLWPAAETRCRSDRPCEKQFSLKQYGANHVSG